MDFEQKFQAMQALTLTGDVSIRRRDMKPRWYVVLPYVARKEGRLLCSGWSGADTMEESVHAAWKKLTDIPAEHYIVVNAYDSASRRAVRWNGFMWADVNEERHV